MLSRRLAFRVLAAMAAGLVLSIVAAPFFSAERFRSRVEDGLERALRRGVTIGELRFSLWPGPGFTIRDVVIDDLPEISAEPFAYVSETRAGISLSSLWRGELTFASITLTQPSVNIAQGPGGAWNYEQMLRSGVGAGTRQEGALPEIVVRQGRINFRSGLRKSIYYFRSADLTLAEESQGTGAWILEFRAEPARTDSYAPRFGTVRGRGRWRAAAGRNGELDMDVEIERSPVAEIASLFRASRVGLSGFLAARAHLSGPAEALALRGNLELSERGDWGLFTLPGETASVPLRGTINLPARRLHLEASPIVEAAAAGTKVPTQPAVPAVGVSTPNPDEGKSARGTKAAPELPAASFAASLDVNPGFAGGQWVAQVRFTSMPVARVLGLLRYLDDSFPDYPQLDGTLDGEVTYRSAEGLRGSVQGARMTWEPGAESSFVLREMEVKMAGDLLDARGFLDLHPADATTAASSPDSAPSAEGPEDWPEITVALDRQSGRVQVSLLGKRLNGAHFSALQRLAPVVDARPPLLEGAGWQASGNAAWQRPGFRSSGNWQGQLLVRGLTVPVEGFDAPAKFSSAPLQLRGESWKISGGVVSVGPLEARLDLTAESPGAKPGFGFRPIALQIQMEELDLRHLDRLLQKVESAGGGFLRRTFSIGSPPQPVWLKNRSVAAKVYLRKVLIEESKYHDVTGDLYWDGPILEARNISFRSRFGTLRAALHGELAGTRPRWSWSIVGRSLSWRGGELDVESEWLAEGPMQSLPDVASGRTEIVWRPGGGEDAGGRSTTRVSLRWNPGAPEPVICPLCVEFRSGSDVGIGDCQSSNGTTLRCPLEDPRTGEKHEINLPISLFGLGTN